VAWGEYARAELKRRGVRAGGARTAVIDLLSAQSCCRSAHEIWEELRRQGKDASLASVYRSLQLLTDAHLVQRVDVGEATGRYEPAQPGGEHHHHALCESCGGITAFEDEALEHAIASLGERLGHQVRAHEVAIRGTCSRCSGRPA
jgi:Fur family transcriptional regulator, ferric uptake regulator